LTRYAQYITRGEPGKVGDKSRLQAPKIGEAHLLDAERREEFSRLRSDHVRDSGELCYPNNESFDVQPTIFSGGKAWHFIAVLQQKISVMSTRAAREDILNVFTCMRATALAAAMAAN